MKGKGLGDVRLCSGDWVFGPDPTCFIQVKGTTEVVLKTQVECWDLWKSPEMEVSAVGREGCMQLAVFGGN